MERIGFQEGREEAPLPRDYFDLIGGTSTGGSWSIAKYSRLCTHHPLA